MRRPPIPLVRGAWLLLFLACATAAPSAAPPAAAVPAGLEVPAGNTLLARLKARGVQIYACAAKDGAVAWTFKGPRADLADGTGAPAGKHFGGPTWEWADGSQVVGEVLQKAQVAEGAIPWLLLRVKSSKLVSPYGAVAFIQRLDTEGGVAPAAGCDEAHLGAEVQVPYAAAYAFFGSRP
jgi:Protein of unknown function (DUF3455)